jgi:hypothetical protein
VAGGPPRRTSPDEHGGFGRPTAITLMTPTRAAVATRIYRVQGGLMTAVNGHRGNGPPIRWTQKASARLTAMAVFGVVGMAVGGVSALLTSPVAVVPSVDRADSAVVTAFDPDDWPWLFSLPSTPLGDDWPW